jgi:hypothetical protein
MTYILELAHIHMAKTLNATLRNISQHAADTLLKGNFIPMQINTALPPVQYFYFTETEA